MATAEFRFYAELNVFIAPRFRHCPFVHAYARDATVKHTIEALGVPHTEVGLILVDGAPADFSYRMQGGERVSVYPHFGAIDIAPCTPVPQQLVHGDKFIADAHLGKLARHLRMLGFDVLFRNSYSDAEVARIAADEERIVLTRDRDLLIRKDVARGCYVHATVCDAQLDEVARRFGLAGAVRPFSRCMNCNGLLRVVDKHAVVQRVPHSSAQRYDRFFECEGCGQIYWEGSHVARMRERIARILGAKRCP